MMNHSSEERQAKRHLMLAWIGLAAAAVLLFWLLSPVLAPFIIALRELVALMSLPVAERDRFVELTEKPR